MKYEKLFKPYTFKNGLEVRNRIMMAPMTTFSSDDNDFVSDAELTYYKKRSEGAGTIITACAYVTRAGKGFDGQMSVADDSAIPRLTELASVINQGALKGLFNSITADDLRYQD